MEGPIDIRKTKASVVLAQHLVIDQALNLHSGSETWTLKAENLRKPASEHRFRRGAGKHPGRLS